MATKKKVTKKTVSKAGKAKPAIGKCGGWKARLNIMPPGTPTLHVTGKCVFPTHGFKVTLKKAVPQGINPAILLLLKVVKRPTGFVIQTPQTVIVTYKLKTKTRYKQVTILPDLTTINVQIVS